MLRNLADRSSQFNVEAADDRRKSFSAPFFVRVFSTHEAELYEIYANSWLYAIRDSHHHHLRALI